MPTAEKEQLIQDTTERLQGAKFHVPRRLLGHDRGEGHRAAREVPRFGRPLQVIKNTLLKRAAHAVA